MTTYPNTRSGWQKLGQVSPAALVDSRNQLHWACQIPSSAGTTLLPAREDDSQTNLEWLRRADVLAGEPVGDPQVRAGIEPATLTLCLLDRHGIALARFGLSGTDYTSGIGWMQGQLEEQLSGPLRKPLRRRELDIPMHPVGEGGGSSFLPDPDHLGELARWFANADLLQREFASATPHSSPIRCWPHHFDIGMLVSLEPAKGYSGKAIGLGLSPGDDTYPEPYWYVNPYPAPAQESLPRLAVGHWHTKRWIGAVLKGSTIVERDGPAEQASLCVQYLIDAVGACRALVKEGR